MVDQELLDAYNRINERFEYLTPIKKSIEYGHNMLKLGIIIFVIITFVPPIININNDDIIKLGLFLGTSLIIIGFVDSMINERKYKSKKFIISDNELAFGISIESLQDIERYRKEKLEFLRTEAVSKLSVIAKQMIEPRIEPMLWEPNLWKTLTKEKHDNIHLLRQNINERIVPNILHGDEKDIDKAGNIIENMARYFLNPVDSILIELNRSILDLKSYPIKGKYIFDLPYKKDIIIIIIIISSNILIRYFAINMFNIDIDANTIVISTATLIAGYKIFDRSNNKKMRIY